MNKKNPNLIAGSCSTAKNEIVFSKDKWYNIVPIHCEEANNLSPFKIFLSGLLVLLLPSAFFNKAVRVQS